MRNIGKKKAGLAKVLAFALLMAFAGVSKTADACSVGVSGPYGGFQVANGGSGICSVREISRLLYLAEAATYRGYCLNARCSAYYRGPYSNGWASLGQQ